MTSTIFQATMLVGQVTAGGTADAEAEKTQQKKWNEYYAKVAGDYEITRGADKQTKLSLKPEAVLFWSNSVRGGETNGAVFVWTYDGRAELVGTIFSHLARNDPTQKLVAHSFQSLSHESLAGQRPGQPGAWSLEGPASSRGPFQALPRRPVCGPFGWRKCAAGPAR